MSASLVTCSPGPSRHVALHQGADEIWCYALIDCARQLRVGRLDARFLADRSSGEAVENTVFPWFRSVTNRLALPHEAGLTFVLVSEAKNEDLVPVRVINGPVVMAEQAWDHGDDHELTRDEALEHLRLPDADVDSAAGRGAVVHAVSTRTGVLLSEDDFDGAWVLALLITYIEAVVGEAMPAASSREASVAVRDATPVRKGAGADEMPEPDQLLTRAMLRELVPVSDMAVWRWVRAGKFPAPVKFNGRNYWRSSEIASWLRAQSAARSVAPGQSR